MTWNVYRFNVNDRKIEIFNIFDHSRFNMVVTNELNKCTSREEFTMVLKSNLMYYFWAKFEYEVLVSPLLGDIGGIKIDIYNQVMLNWDAFVEYVWTYKEVD